jgi:hypothetical protein
MRIALVAKCAAVASAKRLRLVAAVMLTADVARFVVHEVYARLHQQVAAAMQIAQQVRFVPAVSAQQLQRVAAAMQTVLAAKSATPVRFSAKRKAAPARQPKKCVAMGLTTTAMAS